MFNSEVLGKMLKMNKFDAVLGGTFARNLLGSRKAKTVGANLWFENEG